MNKNENADTRVAEGYDIPAVEAWIAENTDYFAPRFHGLVSRVGTLI